MRLMTVSKTKSEFRHFTNFTHDDQFASHVEYYSASGNSCIMSSGALEGVFQS